MYVRHNHKKGCIVDGRGKSPFNADIGVKHGRMEQIGHLDEKAGQVIHADGLCVFIDMHSHSDFSLLNNLCAESKIRQ